MNLREWASNSPEFLAAIPEVDRVAQAPNLKVLSINWDCQKDQISILGASDQGCDKAKTKRDVIKIVAQFFDPLGMFLPVMARCKLLIRKLWQDGIGWDDIMRPEHQKMWNELIPYLKRIPLEKLPRKSLSASVSELTKFYLLCFVDASQNLYAATVYLHVRYGQSATTQLMFAKCRLSPQQSSTTIPRLELMAMLIGVRVLSFCEKELRLPISRKILWSYSQCTLHWITTVKPLCLFVKNRVAEIKKATNVEYRYVNTDSNPADWATRGKEVEELTSFWWESPGWLKTSPEKWPQWNMPPIDNDMINRKESSLDVQTLNGPMYEASLLCPVDSKGPFDLDAKRYSSLNEVLRITAFALRFISNCRSSNKRSEFLTASEIVFACKLWEKSSQERCYGDVFDAIKTEKSHNLVNRLNLRLDKTGILRWYGRLSNANLEPATKWPTLMHPKHPLTRLIVESFHRKLLIGGIAHTLAQVRTRYWIPKGRSIFRKVVNDCQICIKNQGGPYRLTKMPQLPFSRVTSSPPFTWSGLNYFGPLLIKHNGGTQKVWVALFSCLAVRTVHLELVFNMSADGFLLRLRRFVARRGKPTLIICNNALQFKAAKVKMPNGRHLVRPVNFLFPLECIGSKEVPDSIVQSLDEDNSMGVTRTNIDPEPFRQREKRAAFQRAKGRIREIIRDESNLSE